MAISRVDDRTKAEAAAAEWWHHQPFPEAREGVPYRCGVCGAVITAREGTSITESVLQCADCTERVFSSGDLLQDTVAEVGIGPAVEQLPERPEVPEEMRKDSPWAAPDYPPQSPNAAASSTEAPVASMVEPPSVTATAPPPGAVVPQTVTPPRRYRRATWIVVGLAVVSALALVVAAFVWAPWQPKSPVAPTDVTVVAAASTVTVQWAAAPSGSTVDRYLILRDGTQVAAAAGGATSYVDSGLTPGVSYTYTVVAEGNDKQSPSSIAVTAVTATPSPDSLRVTSASIGSVTLTWSPPRDAPAPDRYVITSRTGLTVATVPGTQTSYRVTGLEPASTYAYQVVAYWGDSSSGPSVSISASTKTPAVGAARLGGLLPVHVKVIATGGGTLTKGKGWSDSWTFTPKCPSGACTTVLHGDITPPGTSTHSFKVTLVRHGAAYKGTTTAHVTHCGMSPLVTDVRSTLTVTLRVRSGQVLDGTWTVDKWTGTLRMVSPYTAAGMYYCPAQTVTMTLAG